MKKSMMMNFNLMFVAALVFSTTNVQAQCDTTDYKETFKNGSYVNGFMACEKKEGEWKFHDKQGKLLKVSHYKQGQLSGEQSIWYPNGQQKWSIRWSLSILVRIGPDVGRFHIR